MNDNNRLDCRRRLVARWQLYNTATVLLVLVHRREVVVLARFRDTCSDHLSRAAHNLLVGVQKTARLLVADRKRDLVAQLLVSGPQLDWFALKLCEMLLLLLTRLVAVADVLLLDRRQQQVLLTNLVGEELTDLGNRLLSG